MSRVERINYKKDHFALYVDKNGSVFDVKRCNVLFGRLLKKDIVKLQFLIR